MAKARPSFVIKKDAKGAQQAVNSVHDLLTASDPWKFSKLMAEVFIRVEGQWAGKAAIDIALLDWICQKLNVPSIAISSR